MQPQETNWKMAPGAACWFVYSISKSPSDLFQPSPSGSMYSCSRSSACLHS